MRILAIDPGPEESGAVLFDSATRQPITFLYAGNPGVRNWMEFRNADVLVIEYTPPYTLTTGKGHSFVPAEVVTAAIEIGRFIEHFDLQCDRDYVLVSRLDVKKHLLGRANGTDATVSAAIFERYGGSIKAAKGNKKNPGPLYGFSGHLYAALAVALTYCEKAELATLISQK